MIWDRGLEAGMNFQSVTVSPSKTYGWEANYIAAPSLATTYAAAFDRVVTELRASFDLARRGPPHGGELRQAGGAAAAKGRQPIEDPRAGPKMARWCVLASPRPRWADRVGSHL
jgi:hypothetical protein